MKDVLLHATIRAHSDLENGVQHALGLAASHGARVTALLTEVEPRSASLALPDNMQGGIPPPVVVPRAEEAERIAALLRATAVERGVPCEVLVSDAEAPSAGAQLARHARVRDLVVVSVHGPLQYPRLGLVEAVLFGTGRPLLLVPGQGRPFSGRTAVIAWDATPAASRALYDAMPLLETADDVVMVTVSRDKELEPEESGEEVCRVLSYRNGTVAVT